MRTKKNVFPILFFNLALLLLSLLMLSSLPRFSCAAEQAINQTEVLEAYNLIYRAENDLNNLNYNNLPSQEVYDTIYLAKNAYNNGQYNDSIQYSKDASLLSSKIIMISGQIKELKNAISLYSQLFPFNDLENEILSAENEFAVSNLGGAEKILEDIEKNISKSLLQRYEEYLKHKIALKELSYNNSFDPVVIENYYEDLLKNIMDDEYVDSLELLAGWDYLNFSVSLIYAMSENEKILIKNNIGTKRFNEEINEARIYFDDSDFQNAFLALNRSKSTFMTAIASKAQIEKTRVQINRIAGRGINVSAQNDSLKNAHIEFEKENFEDAFLISKKAFDDTSVIEQNELIFGAVTQSELRDSVFGFIKRNIISIAVLSVLVLVSAFFLTNYVSYQVLSRKKKDMMIELETLTELEKQAQWDFYDKKIIDKKNYEISIKQNQTRNIEVKNNIIVIDDKLMRKKALLKKWFRINMDANKQVLNENPIKDPRNR